MNTFLALRPVWILAIAPLAAALIFASGRRPNLREAWTIAASLLQVALVLSMIPAVLAGETFEINLLPLASGFDLVLKADALGMVFASVAAILWVVTSIYSIGYMRALKEEHQTGYYAAFAICIFAAMGLSFAANPLTFLVFYEVLTIATYPLVAHKRTPEAIRAGRMYLAYTLSAGLALILAVGWIQTLLGAHAFTPGGFLTTAVAGRGTLTALFVLFMLGVGVKASIMPLHAWLPVAMIAPTPVSALLHAVAVVKAGVFGVVRVTMYIFGADTLSELGFNLPLAVIAAFTILVASVIALTQDNLKRRLAYSTISQLSYIVLGVALLSQAGVTASVLHIANHAFMKITLFFVAGAVYAHLHVTNVSEMRGIGRAMPWTMGAFAIGAFGLVGIPPLPGFVSKWWLGLGALQAGEVAFLLVLVGSALLNALYFFPIIWQAFFARSERFTRYDEAGFALVGPPVFTAVASIILGLVPTFGPNFWGLAQRVTSAVLGGTN